MAGKRVHKHEIGIREFRANLSRVLDEVKRGREVVITEHGKPVAKLVPSTGSTTYDRLIAEGVITPPRRPKRPLPKTGIKIDLQGRTLAEMVAEQRR